MTTKPERNSLDKQIDVVHRALVRRSPHFNTMTVRGWQRAWDRNRRLHQIEAALFSQRYDAPQAKGGATDS